MPTSEQVRLEASQKLLRLKEEAGNAGPIHRRDLLKHISRIERELRDYDRFHREARR